MSGGNGVKRMRNPDRIDETLKLISEIWHKYPDQRLCQIIGNCFEAKDLYYIEDTTLIYKLIEYYNRKE